MNQTLQAARSLVREGLDHFFAQSPDETALFLIPWGPDVQARLHEYTVRGKLIRGALVPFTETLFTDPTRTEDTQRRAAAVQAGVAMELMQSFLLIHDDIMDQDDTRRGGPAVHAQYQELQQSSQYGISMGICAGDISAFLAVQQISQLPLPADLVQRLITLFSREIVTVGLAQMQDVHHGYVKDASHDAVMQVYTYKTGRYTFSLPMMTGALIAGASDEQVAVLATLGEHLGRIFQIRDDQLGLFGESEVIGKPVGSDVRENKKTIFREILRERVPADDKVLQFFGAPSITPENLHAVQERMRETGVIDHVETLVAQEGEAVARCIADLQLNPTAEHEMRELLRYNVERTV